MVVVIIVIIAIIIGICISSAKSKDDAKRNIKVQDAMQSDFYSAIKEKLDPVKRQFEDLSIFENRAFFDHPEFLEVQNSKITLIRHTVLPENNYYIGMSIDFNSMGYQNLSDEKKYILAKAIVSDWNSTSPLPYYEIHIYNKDMNAIFHTLCDDNAVTIQATKALESHLSDQLEEKRRTEEETKKRNREDEQRNLKNPF